MNSSTSHPSLPEPRLVQAALAGSILLASLGISIAAVALPTLARAFSADVQDVQGVVLAYLVAVTAAVVPAGRLGDLWGSRRILVAGLVLFTVSSAACAVAPDLHWLMAARVAQGLGAAALMSLPMSLAKVLVPKERVGAAMGLLGTMSAIGTAAGPALGGPLIGASGWRSAFLLLALGGSGLLVLVLRAIPVVRTTRTQGRADRPQVPEAFRPDRANASSLATNVLLGAVMMSTLVVGPFFLAFGLGLSEGAVGMVMAVGPIAAALSGLPAGRITDRYGHRRTILAGLVLAAAGLCCFAVLPIHFGIAGYMLSLVVLTPGFQLFLAANNTAVMLGATDRQRGMVSGLLGLSRNLGLMAGASLIPLWFASVLGAAGVAGSGAALIGKAFSSTFFLSAGLVVLAIVLALAGRAPRQAVSSGAGRAPATRAPR